MQVLSINVQVMLDAKCRISDQCGENQTAGGGLLLTQTPFNITGEEKGVEEIHMLVFT